MPSILMKICLCILLLVQPLAVSCYCSTHHQRIELEADLAESLNSALPSETSADFVCSVHRASALCDFHTEHRTESQASLCDCAVFHTHSEACLLVALSPFYLVRSTIVSFTLLLLLGWVGFVCWHDSEPGNHVVSGLFFLHSRRSFESYFGSSKGIRLHLLKNVLVI